MFAVKSQNTSIKASGEFLYDKLLQHLTIYLNVIEQFCILQKISCNAVVSSFAFLLMVKEGMKFILA